MLPYLILASALSISVTAIYFSIVGLTTLFPGAFWPIVVMGTVLETGKLVCASWLHHNWGEAPRLLKFYLTSAVIILIGITSMGIFGFLSKSHIEQQRGIKDIQNQIAQVDNQVLNEEKYISRQESLIKKAEDTSVNTVERTDFNIELEQQKITDLQDSLTASLNLDKEEMTRLDASLGVLDAEMAALAATPGGLFSNKKKKMEELENKQAPARKAILDKKTSIETRIQSQRTKTEGLIDDIRAKINKFQDSVDIKTSDNPEVEEYESNIRQAYQRISDFDSKKFQLQTSIDELEVEVGPIKYIAELIKDMGGIETVVIEEAVRVVILILVFVFDPLAVVMLLAANMNFRNKKKQPFERLSEQVVNHSPKKPATTVAPTTTTAPATTTAPVTTVAPTTTTTPTTTSTTTTSTSPAPITTPKPKPVKKDYYHTCEYS